MAGVEMSDFVLKEAETLNELGAMLSEERTPTSEAPSSRP